MKFIWNSYNNGNTKIFDGLNVFQHMTMVFIIILDLLIGHMPNHPHGMASNFICQSASHLAVTPSYSALRVEYTVNVFVKYTVISKKSKRKPDTGITSFMKIKKRTGISTEPCGTPCLDMKLIGGLTISFNFNENPDSHEVIHFRVDSFIQ